MTQAHKLVECECGVEVYWELADASKPESDTNKKHPFQADGTPHFCFPCGAKGYGSEGCGQRVISVWVDELVNGVPNGKKRKIMILAHSKGIKEHLCSYARKHQGLSMRKNYREPLVKWFKKEEESEPSPVADNEQTTFDFRPLPRVNDNDIRSKLAEVERSVKALSAALGYESSPVS